MSRITIDFIIPSLDQELTYLAVKSFEKYKSDFDFRYIVIESTNKQHLKKEIEDIGNVIWIQDEGGGCRALCPGSKLPTNLGASTTLSIAIEKYSHLVESECLFICDNDVAAAHPDWMHNIYGKYKEGNDLVGTSLTQARLYAIQKKGMLCSKDLFDKVSLFPNLGGARDSHEQHKNIRDLDKWFPINEPKSAFSTEPQHEPNYRINWDTGELYHEYCRRNNINTYTFKCSLNDGSINETLSAPFKDFHVDRTINDNNEVLYLHLGRGMTKIRGQYHKKGRILYSGWKSFIENNILT
jgi:hypothetical protein